VSATSCEFHPCRGSNVPKTRVLGLLQPLPGDFLWNDATSGSLLVTWDHVMWFPVTWQPSPASCSLVGTQMFTKQECLAFYSHFQVTSAQITSLHGHFWSRGHVTSFPVMWVAPPASHSPVGAQMYAKRVFSAFYSHLQVTSGQMKSLPVTWGHVVISCHMTAIPGELQPCKSSNVHKTPVFGILQPLPGNYQRNGITLGSLLVTWGHLTPFPVTWLSPANSCSPVGGQAYRKPQFSAFYSHFQVTTGQITSLSSHFRSRDVISCHVNATSCVLQPCRSSNILKTWVLGLLQQLPGEFRSNDITSESLPVTWGRVTSFPVLWLPPPAS